MKSDCQARALVVQDGLASATERDLSAQFWLGAGYEQGWFGKADYQEAQKWLRVAAKRGNPDAQNCLAWISTDNS